VTPPLREVVGAVIVRDGRALLTQRRPGKSFAYCHESPGGKVDPGESHHEALRREGREELGIEIGRIPEHPIWCGHVHSTNGGAHVSLYLVTEWTGEPAPREGQGIGWFEPCEIPALVLTPANVAAMAEVVLAVEASAADEPHPSHVAWEGGETEHDGGKACVACGAFVHGFRADLPCSGKHPPPPTVEEARATFERTMADEREVRRRRTPEEILAQLAADPARREAFNRIRPTVTAPSRDKVAFESIAAALDEHGHVGIAMAMRGRRSSDRSARSTVDAIRVALSTLYAAGRASRDDEIATLRGKLARLHASRVRELLAKDEEIAVLRGEIARLRKPSDDIWTRLDRLAERVVDLHVDIDASASVAGQCAEPTEWR